MEKEVYIPYKDINLYAKLFICNPSEKGKMIICVHGFNGTYKDVEFPIAKRLVKQNFNAIVFDFYNGSENSKSGGTIENISILDETLQLQTIIEYVKTLDFVDPNKLYLLGQSQGGLVSSLIVTNEFKALVLYYPAFNIIDKTHNLYSSIDKIKDRTEMFGCLVARRYLAEIYNINPYISIEKYTNPIFLLHGKEDTKVDISYSRDLVKRCKNVTYVEYDNEEHGLSLEGRLKAIHDVLEFLSKN